MSPRLKGRRRSGRTPRPNWDMQRRRRGGVVRTAKDNDRRIGELEALIASAFDTPGGQAFANRMLELDGYLRWLNLDRMPSYWTAPDLHLAAAGHP